MNRTVWARSTSLLTCVAMLLAMPLMAADAGRVEGLVADVEGRPAAGYRVHLVAEQGASRHSVDVDAEGSYSIRALPAGRYALAVETPEGAVTPVASAPLRLGRGELARRDLKLVENDPNAPIQLASPAYGFGTWWAGLTGGAKAWTVVALVVVAGVTANALDSDETSSSTFIPPN